MNFYMRFCPKCGWALKVDSDRPENPQAEFTRCERCQLRYSLIPLLGQIVVSSAAGCVMSSADPKRTAEPAWSDRGPGYRSRR